MHTWSRYTPANTAVHIFPCDTKGTDDYSSKLAYFLLFTADETRARARRPSGWVYPRQLRQQDRRRVSSAYGRGASRTDQRHEPGVSDKLHVACSVPHVGLRARSNKSMLNIAFWSKR